MYRYLKLTSDLNFFKTTTLFVTIFPLAGEFVSRLFKHVGYEIKILFFSNI